MKFSMSFIRGYSRALDLFGVKKNWPNLLDDRERDYKALRGDWEEVGAAIRREEN